MLKSLGNGVGRSADLVQQVVELFAPHFAPGGKVIYSRCAEENEHLDSLQLSSFGVAPASYAALPDVVIHHSERNWLVLCDAITAHGCIDPKRHVELQQLFGKSDAHLIFVTAFPSRAGSIDHSVELDWGTAAWYAAEPTHMIHFGGHRLAPPYEHSHAAAPMPK